VLLAKTDDKLTITVEDDDKVFDTDCLETAKGIGWSNIVNRVSFLKENLISIQMSVKEKSVLIEWILTD